MDRTTLPGPLSRPEQTFSGRTVEVLRDLVLDGCLRGGERINEVELSSALGISRGPLREAIQHLRSEGLLITVSHRGAYVRTFSDRELGELYEVRIALETHAVALAARSPGDQAASDLRAMQDIGTPDLDLHRRLVSLADCPALTDAVVDVLRKVHLARSRCGHRTMRARQALVEHREVLTALADGDAARAAEVLERHLRASLDDDLGVRRSDEAHPPGRP